MVVLSSFAHPTEGIRLKQPNTTAHLNETNLGSGTLYIAESVLSWISCDGSGISIDYRNISLHAVSRDLNAFPSECLLLMLDIPLEDPVEDLGNDDSDTEVITQLRFVPEDRGMLDAMFHAMSACQALHPNSEDSFSDDESDEDLDGVPVDETNSQMANLSIAQNRRAFGVVASRVAEDTVADRAADRAEDSIAEAADRAVGIQAGGAAEDTQWSFGHTRSCFSHTDQADNCSDTGCFDDAEN